MLSSQVPSFADIIASRTKRRKWIISYIYQSNQQIIQQYLLTHVVLTQGQIFVHDFFK